MTREAVKDFLAGSAGCFLAVFASVWVVHGQEHSLQINVIAVMVLVALVAACLSEFVPGFKAEAGATQAKSSKALTPRRGAFYAVGFFVYGLVVAGIGAL